MLPVQGEGKLGRREENERRSRRRSRTLQEATQRGNGNGNEIHCANLLYRRPWLDGSCSVLRIVDASTESRNWTKPTSERTSMSQDGKVTWQKGQGQLTPSFLPLYGRYFGSFPTSESGPSWRPRNSDALARVDFFFLEPPMFRPALGGVAITFCRFWLLSIGDKTVLTWIR
jgi:hypothetical protein